MVERQLVDLESARDTDPGLHRALVAAQTALDNRGRDVVVLDLREMTSLFDYFVLATGTSRRQLHAMSEEIDRALQEGLGDRRLGIEGYEASRWILLDYGDVVIHLFDPETRDYYRLEDLWAQARRVAFAPRPLPPEGGTPTVGVPASAGRVAPRQASLPAGPEAELPEDA